MDNLRRNLNKSVYTFCTFYRILINLIHVIIEACQTLLFDIEKNHIHLNIQQTK